MNPDLIATYIALVFSILIGVERVYSKSKDKTEADLEELEKEITKLKTDRERMAGANVLGRLVDLEQRQRNDETTIARVDQRLENVSNLLNNVSTQIQTLQAADRG